MVAKPQDKLTLHSGLPSSANATQAGTVTCQGNAPGRRVLRSTRRVKGTVADEIAGLKQEPGKNIGVHGSPGLAQSLLYDDLVDELVLLVHPAIASSGKRLYRDSGDVRRLRLVDAEKTSSGCVILTYQRHAGQY